MTFITALSNPILLLLLLSLSSVIFLLSIGADPTESIEGLARKRKLPGPAVISMGEGQEPVAIKAMQTGDPHPLHPTLTPVREYCLL